MLSLVAGLVGWVVILLSIVLTIIYYIETANADEMVRKYGIGTGLIWIFALLALFVINVLGESSVSSSCCGATTFRK